MSRSWEWLKGSQPPLEVRELVRSVNRRVFMVFLRMATHKENAVSIIVYCSVQDRLLDTHRGGCSELMKCVPCVESVCMWRMTVL